MAMLPIGVKVEILVNGVWTDITRYCYQRAPIQVTGGRSAFKDTPEPARAALTLNNKDGRFSPNYTAGAYYPFLTRNTQLRISVTATSGSGNFYSGYRFWGEVNQWPPATNLSGSDVWCDIIAHGPLRRLRHGGGKGSALTRFYGTLTGAYAPIAYWPCEEEKNTTVLGAGLSGGTNMSITSSARPKWKAVSDFNGSHPIGIINKSTWDGLTGSPSYSGDEVFTTPGTYQWTSPVTATITARTWGGGGGGGDGGNGGQGSGGGGGEFASQAVAVTAGTIYTYTVGAGGTGGTGGAGTAGGSSLFTGDAATVTAHGGGGGGANGSGTRGAAGTGSANTTHFNGGQGAASGGSVSCGPQGGGGGGSGGTAAIGNSSTTQSGAAAVTGGGPGGAGGGFLPLCIAIAGSSPASGPGGGGGGAAGGIPKGGASGAAGQVELIYTPPSVPTNNVVRFIALIPTHGGNDGATILQFFTGGTVFRGEFYYGAHNGGKIGLRGYNSVGTLLFDSGAQSWNFDGQTVMLSAELAPSGANVSWALKAVVPGATTLLGSTSGTVTTATLGNVTEVKVDPNGDVTKTGLGHISVQYALMHLLKVSKALDGHHKEMSIDRFARLCAEQAIGNLTEFNETSDHWGFETGTQSWVATNGALTSSTVSVTESGSTPWLIEGNIIVPQSVWPTDGTHSLLLTANGVGAPFAVTPGGNSTGTFNVVAGDQLSVHADVYCPTALTHIYLGIVWSNGTSTTGELDSGDTVFSAGQVQTLKVSGTVPPGATKAAVKFGDHNTDANGTLMYIDHVRVGTRLGPQRRHALHLLLEEIKVAEAGILKDAKELWGLKYRTRVRMINQTPAVTLDFSKGDVSTPGQGEDEAVLKPVIDDQWMANDITVHRHKGSTVRVSQDSGTMSVLEPPAGAGRRHRHHHLAVELDEQLLALATFLLNIGTTIDERYPSIPVNLLRAANGSTHLATIMSAVASAEIGDYVQVTNLPAQFPSSTVKQLIIGYTENIGPYTWDLTWNCTPESPWEISLANFRRW